jgi:hypothetical protein
MLEAMSIDSLTIHGDGADYFITSVGSGMFGSPVVRDSRVARPSRHGEIELSRYYGARLIELSGVCVGTSAADALVKLDALKGALQIGGGLAGDYEQIGVGQGSPQHRLEFERVGDEFTQYCYVTQDGELDAPLDIASRIIPWGTTLRAVDPRFYTILDDGGAEDDSSGYHSLDVLHGETETTSTIGGNTDALPWFTIQGPFDDFALIVMEIDGDEIGSAMVETSLADGNNIDIVTRTRMAIKNQTIRTDLIDYTQTNWAGFPAGEDIDITFTTGGGADAGTICRVRWQDARF